MSVMDIDEFEGKPGITPGRPVRVDTQKIVAENSWITEAKKPISRSDASPLQRLNVQSA